MINRLEAAHLRATETADLLHRELHIDTSRAVDVFTIVEDLGLWLGFKKLTGLLGMFLTAGSGGVMLTTARDVSVQRYTAAHELGHWALDTDALDTFDDEITVLGVNSVEREYSAQIFAAYFLMPPPAVFSALDRLRIDRRSLSASDAYQLSRELGASYEATIRRLFSLDVLTYDRQQTLLKQSRLTAMSELANGMRPQDGRADVWTVDEQWDRHEIRINAHDQVVISLPEQPSAGSRWLSPGVVARRTGVVRKPPPPFADEGATGDEGPIQSTRASTGPRARQPRRGRRLEIVADVEHAFGELANPDQPLSVTDTRFEPGGDETAQGLVVRRVALGGEDQQQGALVAPVGGVGRRLIAVTAQHAGDHLLRLEYARPFGESAALGGFALVTRVAERRHDFDQRQLGPPILTEHRYPSIGHGGDDSHGHDAKQHP